MYNSGRRFLVVIVDRETGLDICDYEISATELFFALNMGKARFRASKKYQPNLRQFTNWYAEGVEV